MGLHDRPYWREQGGGGNFYGDQQPGRGVGFGLPKPPSVVKTLLIINVVVFVIQIFAGRWMEQTFGATVAGWWQLWRYITFQFLHSTGTLFHLGLNMLGLYMLGTPLERHWGPKRFLRFYLTCGVVAGLAYVTIGWIVGNFAHTPIIGASGGVYALVLACAVLFPHMRLILFLFPVPIRLAAALIFGGMILLLAQSFAAGRYAGQFWSDVAHLGGAAAAAVWIFLGPRIGRATSGAREQINRGAWDRKVQARQDQQKEVDRILQKIQDEGIGSLTRREKQTLSDATRRQRHDEKHFRG